jgi:hypothetical protein
MQEAGTRGGRPRRRKRRITGRSPYQTLRSVRYGGKAGVDPTPPRVNTLQGVIAQLERRSRASCRPRRRTPHTSQRRAAESSRAVTAARAAGGVARGCGRRVVADVTRGCWRRVVAGVAWLLASRGCLAVGPRRALRIGARRRRGRVPRGASPPAPPRPRPSGTWRSDAQPRGLAAPSGALRRLPGARSGCPMLDESGKRSHLTTPTTLSSARLAAASASSARREPPARILMTLCNQASTSRNRSSWSGSFAILVAATVGKGQRRWRTGSRISLAARRTLLSCCAPAICAGPGARQLAGVMPRFEGRDHFA